MTGRIRIRMSIGWCLLAMIAGVGCHRAGAGTGAREVQPMPDYLAPRALVDGASAAGNSGSSVRPLSQAGLDFIMSQERFLSTPLTDVAGICAVGYGHVIKTTPCDGSEPESFRKGITKAEARKLLEADLKPTVARVSALITVPLNDNQYAALIDFYFSGGAAANASKVPAQVNSSAHAMALYEMKRYTKIGDQISQILVTRRNNETTRYYDGMGYQERELNPDESELLSVIPPKK